MTCERREKGERKKGKERARDRAVHGVSRAFWEPGEDNRMMEGGIIGRKAIPLVGNNSKQLHSQASCSSALHWGTMNDKLRVWWSGCSRCWEIGKGRLVLFFLLLHQYDIAFHVSMLVARPFPALDR